MTHGIINKVNCYELLGLTPNSTIQEIKSAFRAVSMKTHPDVGGSNESQAMVNYAYETLIDPIRRRLHDDLLISRNRYSRNIPRPKSNTYETKSSSNRKEPRRNIVDRVRNEVRKQADRVRSSFNQRSEDIFEDNRKKFRKTRLVCIVSASCAFLSAALGFLLPPVWIGILPSAYLSFTNLKYVKNGTAIFVFDPYWDIYLKKISKKQAKLETDTLVACLNEKIDNIVKLMSIARNPSCSKDSEARIAVRIAISFFILGYAPLYHEKEKRILIFARGDERIAVRYRHRKGGPANIAFVRATYDYILLKKMAKGFIFATPGLSRNASSFADKNGIAHYSIKEMNHWTDQNRAGDCPGPHVDILEHIDALIAFILRIAPEGA